MKGVKREIKQGLKTFKQPLRWTSKQMGLRNHNYIEVLTISIDRQMRIIESPIRMEVISEVET